MKFSRTAGRSGHAFFLVSRLFVLLCVLAHDGHVIKGNIVMALWVTTLTRARSVVASSPKSASRISAYILNRVIFIWLNGEYY